MQPVPPLPSHGMTTARSGRQRPSLWGVRHREPRTTRNTPVPTSHPYHLPAHTETHDVLDSHLIPSVQPIVVQPGLTVDEDIEQHIGHGDGGRWLCTHCNEKSNKRRSRIRDHVAACLGYDIYPCTGGCGNTTWCVALSVDWTREILGANYNVAVKSNVKRVRIFVSTNNV